MCRYRPTRATHRNNPGRRTLIAVSPLMTYVNAPFPDVMSARPIERPRNLTRWKLAIAPEFAEPILATAPQICALGQATVGRVGARTRSEAGSWPDIADRCGFVRTDKSVRPFLRAHLHVIDRCRNAAAPSTDVIDGSIPSNGDISAGCPQWQLYCSGFAAWAIPGCGDPPNQCVGGSSGVRLLNRSTRLVGLTETGRSYAQLCERIIEDIAHSEAQLSAAEREPTGSIKLVVPETFGSLQLGDAILRFSIDHPNIALSIVLQDAAFRAQDFVEHGYDLAVRWGASPLYIQRQGNPVRPADLERANCLVHLITSSDDVWRFTDGEREIGVEVRGNFTADSDAMLRKATLAGRGVTGRSS